MQSASQTDRSPIRPPSFCYVLTVEDFSHTAEDSSRTVEDSSHTAEDSSHTAEDSSRTASLCGGEGGTEQLTFAIAFVHTNFLHVIVIYLS